MLTRATIDKIVLEKMKDDTIPLPYGGGPYRDSFIGYINPVLKDQVLNTNGFIPVYCYPDSTKALNNEVGAVGNMRIVLDENIDQTKMIVDAISRREFKIDME